MMSVRLMTTQEDCRKIGIKPGVVEPWEDGRRNNDQAGNSEVWYFDATMDDGTKVVISFSPKKPVDMPNNHASPNVNIWVTTPDNVTHYQNLDCTGDNVTYSTEKCEVHYGPHSVIGDLRAYDIKVSPIHGIGAELHYECLVKPYRPGGTAYVVMGKNEEFFYTDMSIIKSRVTGNVTVDGKTYRVEGLGYHDHQWMSINPLAAWHHWFWGRFYAGEYTVIIYDFVASEKYGFTRIPILGILDGNGDVIFDNKKPVECEYELYRQPEIKKDFPRVSKYTFDDDGKKVKLNIEWINEIEVRNMYGNAPAQQRAAFDKMGVSPGYMRYFAKADMEIIEGSTKIKRSGNMIYEFPYIGNPDPRARL